MGCCWVTQPYFVCPAGTAYNVMALQTSQKSIPLAWSLPKRYENVATRLQARAWQIQYALKCLTSRLKSVWQAVSESGKGVLIAGAVGPTGKFFALWSRVARDNLQLQWDKSMARHKIGHAEVTFCSHAGMLRESRFCENCFPRARMSSVRQVGRHERNAACIISLQFTTGACTRADTHMQTEMGSFSWFLRAWRS